MLSKTKVLLFFTAILLALAASRQTLHSQTATAETAGPTYTANGDFKLPDNYRQWVYLTTGFDMSYTPGMSMGHHMFDNVFVNPSSYQAFLETGTWPDKTTLVLEQRGAQGKGSINQSGNFQSEIMGIEVHVKDQARFPGKWAFFDVDFSKADSKTGKLFPAGAECYKCHAAHAAVDTTFVQFYPTLLPIAKSKGTLSAAFQQENSNRAKKNADAVTK